jgi:hypothetical protein
MPTERVPAGEREGIRFRAVFIGTALAMAVGFISPYTYYVSRTWYFGWGTLPNGPVVFAFALVVLNGLVLRLRRSLGLTRADLLVIYVILTLAAALITVIIPYTIGLTAYPFYHARIEHGWEQSVLPHVPLWLRPGNVDSITGFWEGLPSAAAIPWLDWVTPTAYWGIFTLALSGAMLCLGALIRRDWIERQRLSFPLTEIPMALVGERQHPTLGGSALRFGTFWLGFVPSALIILLGWLNALFPAIPGPNLHYAIGESIGSHGLPWTPLWDMVINLSPATIGVMCLVPGEISFSVWAFYLIFRTYQVVCASFGLVAGASGPGGFNPRSFFDYAGYGGFIAVSAIVVYRARDAIGVGLRRLLGRLPKSADMDREAPMTDAAAVLGFVLSNAVMLWWVLNVGMSWWSFALIMAALYASIIGTTRLAAVAGLLNPRPQISPRWLVLRTVGARPIGPQSLSLYSLLTMGYMLEPHNFPSVYMLNGFKLFHNVRMRAKAFPWVVVISTVGVLVAGSMGVLYYAYRYGAVSMICWPITAVPTCAFREFNTTLRSPENADNWLRAAVFVGGGFTLLLTWLSSRFLWWPLSPIGFLVASVMHTNRELWMNAIIGWLIATLIRRFGGLKLYRELRPAFLGIIFGHYLTDAAMAVLASLVLGARGMTAMTWDF